MALLQDYKVLFEQNTEIKEIFYQGQRIWPSVITPPDPKLEPFYVENISNNVETLRIFKRNIDSPTLTIEYSTDKDTWNTLGTTSTTALTMTLQPSDKIYLRCNTNRWTITGYYGNFITGVSKVGGNIMSLLYGNNFTGNETSFPDTTLDNIFSYLFNNGYSTNVNLIDASYLLLPVTTLAQECYYGMFQDCTSLTTTPKLPATTLAKSCYGAMFQYCSSLIIAPALPATTLSNICYGNMFNGCSSLIAAPVLPATTLTEACYGNMFYGCTSLTTAPELPATTLTDSCYYRMFNSCTSLNTVKCLATNISASDATYDWLYNVSSTGTFTKAAGVTWPSGESGIPSGWTVEEV